MTTEELKQYIDRVLGNNIRCLLPSYWWKRLFSLVVDKVEKVEKDIVDIYNSLISKQEELVSGTNIKTINKMSILGKGDLNIGGLITKSETQLNALDVPLGMIASVAYVGTRASFSSLPSVNKGFEYGFVRLYGIDIHKTVNDSVILSLCDNTGSRVTAFITLLSTFQLGYSYASATYYTDDGVTTTITFYNGYGKLWQEQVNRFNKILSENDWRFAGAMWIDSNYPLENLDGCIDAIIDDKVCSDAYIKGESWDKLVKGDAGETDAVLAAALNDLNDRINTLEDLINNSQ